MNSEVAPLPVVRGATIEPLRSAPKRTFPRNYPGTSPDPEPAALARSEHGFWFMTGPGLARIKGYAAALSGNQSHLGLSKNR